MGNSGQPFERWSVARSDGAYPRPKDRGIAPVPRINKHFEDAKYYPKWAGETVRTGVSEELEPLRERVSGFVDREGGDPEPGRFDGARAELGALQERAEGETRKPGADARGWIDVYRSERRES